MTDGGAVRIDPAAFEACARDDRELAYRLRGFTATLRLPFTEPALDVMFEEGRVVAVQLAGGGAALQYQGADAFWRGFFQKDPRRPGYESMAMGIALGVRVTGADAATVASYYGGFSRLLDVARNTVLGGDQAVQVADGHPFRGTDTAVGRYAYVTVERVEARIFYEEAGTGDIPLLLQHTAGGDSRQYRHILADPEVQKRFRIIAYDLPYHGRSLPPFGVNWWAQDYKPNKHSLMSWVVGIADALKLDRPVFMGCSVGGNLALDLAAHHGDRFSAFIALNGWYAGPAADDAVNDKFRHPRLSSDHYAARCLGITGPFAPEAFRQEVYWNYRSNAPGVYAGDNDYFVSDHDLSKDGHLIDAAKTPVYLLVGEYDPAAVNETHGGPAAARNIPGLEFRIMKGLSHFAPTDDPLAFRRELLPVADEILARLQEGRA